MYKPLETPTKIIKIDNGTVRYPIATLKDEAGGEVNICIDDHCYVIFIKGGDGSWKNCTYIFPELHDFMKTLPNPYDYGK